MSDTLISRMEPIPKGTTIELHVTSVYEVTLDDNWYVDGQESATLEEIEEWCGKYQSDVIREVRANAEPASEEADWFLPNLLPADYRTFRFDRKTERTFASEDRYVALADVLPEVTA